MECKEFLRAWKLKQQLNNCEKMVNLSNKTVAAITWGVYERRMSQGYKVLIYRFIQTLEFMSDIYGNPPKCQAQTFDKPWTGKGETFEKAFNRAFSFIPREYLRESEIIER